MNHDRSCINCPRFHWGICYDQGRICWTCGEIGHMQRYCSKKQRHGSRRGGLLPGTSSWCAALGLNKDPSLKCSIISTLKQYPGATVYLNDECIYRGIQTYFYRDNFPHRLDLVKRLKRTIRADYRRRRLRSRSTSRERVLERSRSPLERYSRKNSPEIIKNGEFDMRRSRAPAVNDERSSLSPMIDFADVEVVSPPRSTIVENILPQKAPFTPANKRSLTPIRQPLPLRLLSRPSLRLHSENIPLSSLLDLPIDESVALPRLSKTMPRIEDPHFVLEISEDAPESEIITGYQQRMWEIQLEKASEGHYEQGDMANKSRWEESTRILAAARAQLLRPQIIKGFVLSLG